MKSLYESLLADIDDTLDKGDTITTDVLANDENSLLREIFPIKSKITNPYDIIDLNGKKTLSLKVTNRSGYIVTPEHKVTSIIGKVDTIFIEGASFIDFKNSNLTFKDAFCERYIGDLIDIYNYDKQLSGVNLCAIPTSSKSISTIIQQNIKLGYDIQDISNCSFEINSTSKIIPSTLYLSSIPTFKNVSSKTIEKIFIGASQSLNHGYPQEMITKNITENPIWDKLFEFGYTTIINKKKGQASVKIKDMESIYKTLCACDFNYFTVDNLTEWPIRIKKNAKLKDILDISKFTNLSEVIIEDHKISILFTNQNNPPKKSGAMMNSTYYWSDFIEKLPVTTDGWKVFIYKKV